MAASSTSCATAAPAAGGRGPSHAMVYLFLVTLIAPASDLITGKLALPGLAAAALVAFAASFVLGIEVRRRRATPNAPLSRTQRAISGAMLVVMLALAIATTLAIGRGWWLLFMFVVTTSALLVPVRLAPATIAGV
ncbi:MAG TPA: hypothetical protein VH165_35135, partial [Kofleriaceae bacterium]|nr:hypothetical protein [Kofleriaceae bacterium]